MKPQILTAALAVALAVTACKNNEDAPAPAAPEGLLGQATAQAKTAEAKAALPQPDTSRPLSAYTELKSGNQIMFQYVAASKLPPDFPKLAEAYSSEYRRTNDSFRRNDLLQAIKPQLEAQIAAAEADPYGWMEVDDARLDAYDFERKGFPVGEFADDRYRYFGDNSSYTISWANYNQLSFAPVTDEAAARQLESMRTRFGNTPRLRVYYMTQSADLNSQRVNAVVTRVQITDRAGRVLAEYGPDGSIAPATPGSDECLDAAACAAAAL